MKQFNNYYLIKPLTNAAMAELADALDLGSSEATRTGSIPASRTKLGILILIQSINIKPIQIASEMALF